ncbi:MAG: DUF4340 domain-containing protein [Anaerolineae bacterium]|nr:DUF4340 domain-containing protein [Anaerolineae bacterium]
MNRTNQILAAALAVQIVLVAVAFWPKPASVAGGESLFDGLEAEQITQLTISDETGNQVKLSNELGSWVLPEAGDYPCLESKVPEFLEKIVALKTNRLVTQTPASHKRLKVADDDFQRQIELELADGTTHRLYLGSSPRYGVSHVRAGGQNEVYLASLSASEAGVNASNWVDTLYFSVAQDQIVALTVENANGCFEFEKDEAGTWTMKYLAADETLNENNVKSLATRVSSLRMLRPLGKTEQDDYGLKEPNAIVTVETRDGEGNTKTYAIRVGAKSEEDNSYVVIASESPYYVRVSNYTVKDFVEKARDDFLELPPTPTPTPEPTS